MRIKLGSRGKVFFSMGNRQLRVQRLRIRRSPNGPPEASMGAEPAGKMGKLSGGKVNQERQYLSANNVTTLSFDWLRDRPGQSLGCDHACPRWALVPGKFEERSGVRGKALISSKRLSQVANGTRRPGQVITSMSCAGTDVCV